MRRTLARSGFVDIAVRTASLPWNPDTATLLTFLRRSSPTHVAATAAAGEGAAAMYDAIAEVFAPRGGPVRVAAEYLQVTAQR